MNPRPNAFRFEALTKQHHRESFCCASAELNLYLRQFARKDAERRVAAVFVMIEGTAPTTIVGYYTLSAFSVDITELPEAMQKKLPRYPRLPATLLGRLARDDWFPGTGTLLLINALTRAYQMSSDIASLGVVAEAKDDGGVKFYHKFGFVQLGHNPNRVFLPMKTVEDLLR